MVLLLLIKAYLSLKRRTLQSLLLLLKWRCPLSTKPTLILILERRSLPLIESTDLLILKRSVLSLLLLLKWRSLLLIEASWLLAESTT